MSLGASQRRSTKDLLPVSWTIEERARYHADQRLLAEMFAVTEVEDLQVVEEEAWQILLCLFTAEYSAIWGSKKIVELCVEEENQRSSTVMEERLERSQASMRAALEVHGCPAVSSTSCRVAPIKILDAEAETETWRRLPTMFPRDDRSYEPVDAKAVAQALIAEGDEECDIFLLALLQDSVAERESRRRDEIECDWRSAVFRLVRNRDAYLERLRAMERELMEEADARILLTLSEEGKIAFKGWPVTRSERDHRAHLMLQEECEYSRHVATFTENTQYFGLIDRFAARLGELVKVQRTSIVQRISRSTSRRMFEVFFLPWRNWAHRIAKLRRARQASAVLEKKHRGLLLRRYCRLWNEEPEQQRFLNEREALRRRQRDEHTELVLLEDEERARAVAQMEWQWGAEQIAEVFFTEKDSVHLHLLRQSAASLVVATLRRHQMRRLITWYRFWKIRSMRRKCAWLYGKSSMVLLSRFVHKWRICHISKKGFRVAKERMLQDTTAEKRREHFCFEESLARLRVEALQQGVAASRHREMKRAYLVASRRMQERCIERMEVSSVDNIKRLRFRFWLWSCQYNEKSRKAEALALKSQRGLLQRYFGRFAWRYSVLAEGQRAVTQAAANRRTCTALEEDESRQRLGLAAFEDWSRRRREFRLQGVFSAKSSRMLTLGMGQFSSNGKTALLGFRWHTWCRFLKHRRHMKWATVRAEHLECDAETVLRRRYFRVLRQNIALQKEQRQAAARVKALREQHGALHGLEEGDRTQVSEDEQWAWTRLTLAHARVIGAIRRRQQVVLVSVMASLMEDGIRRRMLRKWMAFNRKRLHCRKMTPRVLELEALCAKQLRSRYYKTLAAHWWQCIRPRLAEAMARRLAQNLAKRYFRHLAPATIRAARLSRARANLQRAQAVARSIELSTTSVRVVKSQNPFLPPLRAAPRSASLTHYSDEK